MASNDSRGARYKARSREWLEKAGFTVYDMEHRRMIMTPMGPLPRKKDQLGSDLAYLAPDVTVYVQVKSGGHALARMRREATAGFAGVPWPVHSRRELHVWRTRARAPEVYACP